MKKVFVFAAMLVVAASCTVSEIDSATGSIAPVITATYEYGSTKTTITTDEDGVGTIWWTPADEINVFYGTTSTHYISKNTENATTVAFGTTDVIGSTEQAETNIWGLYPYDENAVCDGTSVTTTIPSSQKAVASAFDDDLFTSLAHSSSTAMTFYNVLGGIKFSLSRDDIQSITFKGNNNEDIAGKVKLEMTSESLPVATVTAGEKIISITPKSGTTFAKNTNYYIALLPTVLSKGFTMTFSTGTRVGTFEYSNNAVEIKRSVFGRKMNIDQYASFDDEPVGLSYVDLGLSVLWCTCNVKALKSNDIGGFFMWGETVARSDFREFSRQYYCQYSNDAYTKYNKVDGLTILEGGDDAATYSDNTSRTPTRAEWNELFNNCTWTVASQNGEKGYKVTSNISGYTDASIFLPLTGYFGYGSFHGDTVAEGGVYWTSELNEIMNDGAFGVNILLPESPYYYSCAYKINSPERECGCVVRPVKNK